MLLVNWVRAVTLANALLVIAQLLLLLEEVLEVPFFVVLVTSFGVVLLVALFFFLVPRGFCKVGMGNPFLEGHLTFL